MRGIPHQISVYGRIYDVRWGTEKDPDWDPGTDWGMVVDGYTRKGCESFAIILNPRLRLDSRLAHETLLHEVIHIINWREREWRKTHPIADRGEHIGLPDDLSVTTKWRPLSHDNMHRIDMPLARTLYDNGAVFECVCRRCRRKK